MFQARNGAKVRATKRLGGQGSFGNDAPLPDDLHVTRTPSFSLAQSYPIEIETLCLTCIVK
jgi:hypothetical protein